MIWTTGWTLGICGLVFAVVIIIGLIIWRAGGKDWYAATWFGVGGGVAAVIVVAFFAASITQQDKIRTIKCRTTQAPVIFQAHPDWTVQETRDVLAKVCPG